LMLVKQQQLGVFFFYTGKSHKIGEITWWCCNNGLDGSGARKNYYNYITATTCSWNFPMRQRWSVTRDIAISL
jgi:hypothetical protein